MGEGGRGEGSERRDHRALTAGGYAPPSLPLCRFRARTHTFAHARTHARTRARTRKESLAPGIDDQVPPLRRFGVVSDLPGSKRLGSQSGRVGAVGSRRRAQSDREGRRSRIEKDGAVGSRRTAQSDRGGGRGQWEAGGASAKSRVGCTWRKPCTGSASQASAVRCMDSCTLGISAAVRAGCKSPCTGGGLQQKTAVRILRATR